MSRVRATIKGLVTPWAPLVASIPGVPGFVRCASMRPDPYDGMMEVAYRYGGIGIWDDVPVTDVWLDLSAPAGLDVASRYIGTHYNLTFTTAPEFDRYVFGWPERVSGWAIRAGEQTVVFMDTSETAESNWPTVRIVGLARAETHAEALALIVEHCAMEGK